MFDDWRSDIAKCIDVVLTKLDISKAVKSTLEEAMLSVDEAACSMIVSLPGQAEGAGTGAASAGGSENEILQKSHFVKQLMAAVAESGEDCSQLQVKLDLGTNVAGLSRHRNVLPILAKLLDSETQKLEITNDMDELVKSGVKTFRECVLKISKTLGEGDRDMGDGLWVLFTKLEKSACDAFVAWLEKAKLDLEDVAQAFELYKCQTVEALATELENDFQTAEKLESKEFLQAFGKASLKKLAPPHKKLELEVDTMDYLLRELGRSEDQLPVAIGKCRKILARSHAMSIKWGVYTVLEKEEEKAGSQIEKLKKLVEMHFDDDLKEHVSARTWDLVLEKTGAVATEDGHSSHPEDVPSAAKRRRISKSAAK